MAAPTEIEVDGQYRVLRDAAGAVDRDDRRYLAVAGAEAGEYLQGQLTNDVEALEPGQGCYSALLDRKGRMQADMRVLRTADGFEIETGAEGAAATLKHLSTYKVGRQVEIAEDSERSCLSLIGPAATELALEAPLRPEHAHRVARIGEIECLAVATDLGVDLQVDRDFAPALAEAIVEAGVELVGAEAAEIVRVESGRPRFGREMTTSTIPQEAGINDRAISFTKGCYIGQETVARLHYKGKPNRSLRGLRLGAPANDGDPVVLGERELGAIGTAVVSPAHGPIALAILRREAEPGATVEVAGEIEATVVELPF